MAVHVHVHTCVDIGFQFSRRYTQDWNHWVTHAAWSQDPQNLGTWHTKSVLKYLRAGIPGHPTSLLSSHWLTTELPSSTVCRSTNQVFLKLFIPQLEFPWCVFSGCLRRYSDNAPVIQYEKPVRYIKLRYGLWGHLWSNTVSSVAWTWEDNATEGNSEVSKASCKILRLIPEMKLNGTLHFLISLEPTLKKKKSSSGASGWKSNLLVNYTLSPALTWGVLFSWHWLNLIKLMVWEIIASPLGRAGSGQAHFWSF